MYKNKVKQNTAMMYSYNAIEYVNKPLVKPILKSMKSVPAGVPAIPTGWDVQADTDARSQGDIPNTLATTLPIYTYMGAVTVNPGCLKYTGSTSSTYKLNEPAKRLDIATANIINDITAKMYTDLEITNIVPKYAAEGTDSALTRYAIAVSETAKQWIYDYVNFVRTFQFVQHINNKVVTLSTRANLFVKAYSRARVRTAVESLMVALKQYPVPKHMAKYITAIATIDANNDACNGTLTSVTLDLGWKHFSQDDLVTFCTVQGGRAGANGVKLYNKVETNDTKEYEGLSMGGNMLATVLHNYYTMTDAQWADFCVKFSGFMAANLEQHSIAILAGVANLSPYITAIARVPEHFIDAYDFNFDLSSLDINYIQSEAQLLTLNMVKEVFKPQYANVAGTSVVVGEAPILGDDILQPMSVFKTNGILQWVVPQNATYEPLIDLSNLKITKSYGIITDNDPEDAFTFLTLEKCAHIPTKFYVYTYGDNNTIYYPNSLHERVYRTIDKYMKASVYMYNVNHGVETIPSYNWAEYGRRPVTLEPIDQLVAQAAPMVYGFKTPLSKITK